MQQQGRRRAATWDCKICQFGREGGKSWVWAGFPALREKAGPRACVLNGEGGESRDADPGNKEKKKSWKLKCR